MLKNFVFTYITFSIIFIFIMLFSISFLTLWERKLLGGIQRRHGPIYTGIFGILQPFADGLKLIFKTFNFPSGGYYHVFLGASIFSLTLSLLPWTILPFNEYFVFSDINCSLLLILLISSLNKYTILFSGWSSNSKYGVLGSIRSGAQMASYEIPLLLAILPIILLSSNLNFINIVYFQINFFWFILLAPNAFIFFVCLLAETNRAPFDLPEAESELVAGYNIEYSSISFAVFFLAEYNHIIIAAFLFSLLFLGGWDVFYFNYKINFQTVSIVIKTLLIINLIIYVRGVLPRYKFTDLITMCWQVFVPVTTFIFLIVWSLSLSNNFIAHTFYSINLYPVLFLYFFIEIFLFLERFYTTDFSSFDYETDSYEDDDSTEECDNFFYENDFYKFENDYNICEDNFNIYGDDLNIYEEEFTICEDENSLWVESSSDTDSEEEEIAPGYIDEDEIFEILESRNTFDEKNNAESNDDEDKFIYWRIIYVILGLIVTCFLFW